MQTLCPESGLQTAPNWPKIRKMTMTSQFSDMTSSSIFFDVVLFLLSSLVTGPSFMSILSLVWNYDNFFYKGLTRNSEIEIPPSEFCPISADWGKLWIPNLAWMSLIERYWMLQNSRVTAFSVLELLRENQLGGGGNFTPTQIRVNGQNLLSLTNYFLNFSNTYWQNVPAIDSLVFFSEHISGTAILAQASGNTCK